ncbi:hypothetical protein AAG570_013861 [Ranatra chinensis]|uniref:APCDD1 domain-containing protein n=1 Tax=Ranatra chinensis TaxID=642074 RepID=A0ABD0YDK7_9HEMI
MATSRNLFGRTNTEQETTDHGKLFSTRVFNSVDLEEWEKYRGETPQVSTLYLGGKTRRLFLLLGGKKLKFSRRVDDMESRKNILDKRRGGLRTLFYGRGWMTSEQRTFGSKVKENFGILGRPHYGDYLANPVDYLKTFLHIPYTKCEVRAGPIYMLRTSLFSGNDSFMMTQYHYSDGDCSKPLYSVTARGRYFLRGRSWLTPGATQTDYSLARVSVTPYTPQVADVEPRA